MRTPLQARILEQLRLEFSGGLKSGDRINEAEIADELGVSRTPIRRVLQRLQEDGVLAFEPRRGLILRDPESLLKTGDGQAAELLDERVMRDMAIGELNAVMSERALMQRYAVANGVLASTLRRLTRDHLVEPSPGHGWIFADVGPKAMAESYHFRQIIEPAAILADGYEVDVVAVKELDDDHAHAIEQVHQMDRRRLFELDAWFHQLARMVPAPVSL